MVKVRHEVRRYRNHDGRVLFLAIYLGSRSRGWKSFRPQEVPAFEGESAEFEINRAKGQWTFLRRL
jgi:hypothetical protein